MAQCKGSRVQMVKFFLVFIYIWLEDVAKTSKVPKSPAQCKYGPGKNRASKRNHHSIVPFFNNQSPPPRQFLRVKILLKKNQLREIKLLNVNLNWGGLAPLDVHALLQLVIFMTKRKSPKKSSSGLLFTAKILQKAMCLTFLYLGQSTYKI